MRLKAEFVASEVYPGLPMFSTSFFILVFVQFLSQKNPIPYKESHEFTLSLIVILIKEYYWPSYYYKIKERQKWKHTVREKKSQ